MKKYIIIIISIFLIFPQSISAQKKKIEKANKFLSAEAYYKALELYTKIFPKLKDKNQKAEVSFNAGICSRHLMNPQGQITWFRKAILYKYQNPQVYLYLADGYLMKGQYDNAKENYEKYKELVPDDIRADNGLKSCELSQQWIEKPTRYAVNLVPTINSRQNDFAPTISRDTSLLIFTSTRTSGKGEKINYNSGEPFADLYFCVKDKKNKWTQPQPLMGDINSEFDDGSACLSIDGRTIYFTSCPIVEDKKVGCKIYKSTYSNEKWSSPEIVPIFSDSSISVGHPFLSPDQLTLYFVSDNPKGIGGKDIWKITRRTPGSDRWSSPELLSSDINTKYDELYPSMDKKGNLYFSSNGRPGMGGLDIYKATPQKDGSWKVENMKYPINSNGNDFAITFNPYNNSGYFSSSRNYAKGDDIYHFYKKPLQIYLKGYVINEVNHAYLPNVNVEISGSDGSIIKKKTNSQGSFNIKLKENLDYIIVTSKKMFLKATGSISTKGIKEDGKKLEIEIYMKPSVGTVKIPNIRYDYADTTLREESKVALDELVELLKLNPNVVIELRANTDYRGSEQSNLKLSQGRANSVVAYLVSRGINKKRLVAKGMGESDPLKVDKLTAQKYPFLKAGDVLTEDFIKSLPTKEEQEICNELNRRTEFRVISENFKDNYERFGDN